MNQPGSDATPTSDDSGFVRGIELFPDGGFAPALEDMPVSLVVRRCENRLLVDGAGFADSESRDQGHSAL